MSSYLFVKVSTKEIDNVNVAVHGARAHDSFHSFGWFVEKGTKVRAIEMGSVFDPSKKIYTQQFT